HHMFGFNALEIVGVGVPIILLSKFLFSRDLHLSETPLFKLWVFYVFVNLVSFTLILSSGKFIGSMDFFFRILNGFVGYFMLQAYIRDREDFRKLLIIILLAGLFPMLVGVYQAVTGDIWNVRQTAGGLIRGTGFYHDIFSIRSFAYITIVAIILYWSYYINRGFLKKSLLIAYLVLCSVSIFKAYSKAGFAVAVIWIISWTFLNKKFSLLAAIIVALILANFATGNILYKEIAFVFSKESAAIEGTGETKYILSGRLGVWEGAWHSWKSSSNFNKFFGLGSSGGAAHNDYLKTLISGGILSLVAYILLLVMIGWKILRNLAQNFSRLNMAALMIFLMWLVDTIGLVPSMYPSYQWYVWGFIGLAFRGIEGLNEKAGS
ncbi:MAG: hypothetical protein V3V76_06100, partial [Candidatus Adiutricales bacterium]